MRFLLRLLRVTGLGLGGLLLTTGLAAVSGGLGVSIFPGLLTGLALWIGFPVVGHLRGRHALAFEGWASLLLGAGAAFVIIMKLVQGIRC